MVEELLVEEKRADIDDKQASADKKRAETEVSKAELGITAQQKDRELAIREQVVENERSERYMERMTGRNY